jgi:GNAT superfamily N-acetyltransferase
VLIFPDKSIWSDIQNQFQNFRSLETNEKIKAFNTYITYELTIETFNPIWSDLSSVEELPKKHFPIPKRYRHLDGGVAYAYIKNDDVLSFAAAPHVFKESETSFAIIRGMETKLLERRQGFAARTLTKLCQDLLALKLIKSIYLWVEKSNTPAINLYKKMGFIEKSRIHATYCDPQ